MSQGHDNKEAFAAGNPGAGSVVYNVVNELKSKGLVPQDADPKNGESIYDYVKRHGIDPHDFSSGQKNPAVMSIVHELLHGLKANMEEINPGSSPSPIVVPNAKEANPLVSDAHPEGVPLDYMTQTEDQLLVQTWSFDTIIQPLYQEADGGRLPSYAVARFQAMPVTVADVLSRKNQVYPVEVWEQNVPMLQSMAKERRLLGKNDHPSPHSRQQYDSIAGNSTMYTQVYWSPNGRRVDGGRELLADGYVLDTTDGRDLHTHIQAGVPVDVSSRGYGKTQSAEWNGHNNVGVVKNFRCKTFDAVIGGASPGAGFRSTDLQQSVEDELVRLVEDAPIDELPRLVEDTLPRLV